MGEKLFENAEHFEKKKFLKALHTENWMGN